MKEGWALLTDPRFAGKKVTKLAVIIASIYAPLIILIFMGIDKCDSGGTKQDIHEEINN